MKLRIFPQTSDVKAILQERITTGERLIDEAKTELALMVTEGLEWKTEGNNRYILLEGERIKEYRQQIQMLDSHGKPETMMEIDL